MDRHLIFAAVAWAVVLNVSFITTREYVFIGNKFGRFTQKSTSVLYEIFSIFLLICFFEQLGFLEFIVLLSSSILLLIIFFFLARLAVERWPMASLFFWHLIGLPAAFAGLLLSGERFP